MPDYMRSGLLLASALLAVPPVLNAQSGQAPVVTIPNAVTCATCSIAAARNVVLSEWPLEYALVEPPAAVVDGPEQSVLVLVDFGVLQFDAVSGRFRRLLARRGSGPGEVRSPSAAWRLPGDSTLVLDPAQARALVLGPSGSAARTIAFPDRLGVGLIVHWPDTVLLTGAARNATSARLPLHHYNFSTETAERRRSFGLSNPSSTSTPRSSQDVLASQFALLRYTAHARNGGFLSAPRNEYVVTLWNHQQQPLLSWRRAPDWFTGVSTGWIGYRDAAPSPSLRAVAQDARGMVWTVTHRPAAKWRDAWADAPSPDANGEIAIRQIAVHELYTSHVEVLHPGRNQLLAHTDFPGFTVGLLQGGVAALYTVDFLGEPRIVLKRLSLRGQ